MKALTSGGFRAFLFAVTLIPAMTHAQQQPGVVEIVTCNFINGNDAGALARPMSAFNAWADEHNIENFNVSTLTPIFMSDVSPYDYDVVFFNRWTNASAMGQNMEMLYGPGGDEAIADFADVVDCGSTAAYAAILLQAPGEARNGGPIQFMNCTVNENRTLADGVGAINQWAEAAGDVYGAGHAVLLPLAGQDPDASFTFKWVVLHESYQNYGDSLGALFAPGAPSIPNIISPVMDCDSARVYSQVVNRQAQTDD